MVPNEFIKKIRKKGDLEETISCLKWPEYSHGTLILKIDCKKNVEAKIYEIKREHIEVREIQDYLFFTGIVNKEILKIPDISRKIALMYFDYFDLFNLPVDLSVFRIKTNYISPTVTFKTKHSLDDFLKRNC